MQIFINLILPLRAWYCYWKSLAFLFHRTQIVVPLSRVVLSIGPVVVTLTDLQSSLCIRTVKLCDTVRKLLTLQLYLKSLRCVRNDEWIRRTARLTKISRGYFRPLGVERIGRSSANRRSQRSRAQRMSSGVQGRCSTMWYLLDRCYCLYWRCYRSCHAAQPLLGLRQIARWTNRFHLHTFYKNQHQQHFINNYDNKNS